MYASRQERLEAEQLQKQQLEEKKRAMQKELFKYGRWAALVILLFTLTTCTIYTVEEGHVGILKTFGEATEQVDPGLHIKSPIGQVVEEVEVRTRKNVEELPAATSEQMATTAIVSVNWTVNKASALDLYKDYGSLEQFENRILDPKLRSASKAAISTFTAEELIKNRGKAILMIEDLLISEMSEYPVKLDSIQIENITFPPVYMRSIEAKQSEKNLADAEQHKLDRQALTAQQTVNTANANRDAAKATADGLAYAIEEEAKATAAAIEVKGLAEAKAIEAKGKALRNNPLIVNLTAAQNWNGQQPSTVLGGGENLFLQFKP